MTRRDLLRLLLASPLATTFDVERVLWVPKPIIVVPAMPMTVMRRLGFIEDPPLRDDVQWFTSDIEITSFLDEYRSYIPIYGVVKSTS